MSPPRSAASPDPWLAKLQPRLADQFRFLIEADRLKSVIRRTPIADGSRRENTAEHSWHLTLFALVLEEWATGPVEIFQIVQMLILHDLVEIEAGDTLLYDTAAAVGQAEREKAAADLIFGLLPPDQGQRLRALWDEFEAAETTDARFAKAIDRLQPILLNHLSAGGTWAEFGIDEMRVRTLTQRIGAGSPTLWDAAQHIFADAVRQGWLRPAPPER